PDQAADRAPVQADQAAGEPDPEPAPPASDDPPASDAGGARAAIAYARDQIGEPYVWGADGPGSWDCSGLTSKAWAAGGKQLPHYSVAQYEQSTPISAAQLRPGDLVFWGENDSPSSIFHVALYTGGGQIIHAPRTGRPVTEESMYYWRTPDFYARP
ncbi:NlpC/P60 family protein, partial [Nocardioides sp.]